MQNTKSNVAQLFEIGDCTFDPSQLVLKRDGQVVKLSAKVSDLLLLILQSEHYLLDFETAIEQIWNGNEGVGKKAFTNAIWMIRKSFKDVGIDEEVFESIPKKGYRLLLNVEPITKTKSKLFLYVCLFALAIFALSLYFVLETPHFFSTIDGDISKQKVTNYEGVEEHISISNSGKYMAFSWIQSQELGQIYVKEIGSTSTTLNLISSGKGQGMSPSWSPSEKSIAFVEIKNSTQCEIRIHNLLLNKEYTISERCHYLPYKRVVSWSNTNEDLLAYSKQLDDRVAIFLYDLATNSEIQLTSPKSGEIDYIPRLIDNTLYFARETQEPYKSDLIKTDFDKNAVVFKRGLLGIVDFDIDQLTGNVYLNYMTKDQHSVVLMTPDGQIVSQYPSSGLPSSVEYSETRGLYISDHISKEYIGLVSIEDGAIGRKISSSSRDLYGSYLSQSQEVAFLSNRGKQWSIWKSGKLGSRNLTQSLGNASVPAVSPDGRTILSRIQTQDGNHIMVAIDSETFASKELALEGYTPKFLSWSFDGKKVLFSAIEADQLGLFSFDINTAQVEQLTTQSEIYAVPLNETQLLVTKQNIDGLWRYDLPTGQYTLITERLKHFDFGAFFVQDGAIYYLLRTKQHDTVMRIDKGVEQIVAKFSPNSIRKFFGISKANSEQFIATLKLANESDISLYHEN